MTQFGVTPPGEMSDGDRYVTWDAAYALGALTSRERREYEVHLETCSRCRSALAELSGVPALLALLDVDEVRALDDGEPEPPPLRPEVRESVLAKVTWRRRRSRWLTSAAVAVAAALLAVGVVIGIRPEVVGLQSEPPQAADQTLEMTEVVPTPFSATVTLTSYAWGTRVDMACTYGDWTSSPDDTPPSNLGMVVVTRDGSRTEIATWLGFAGATALPSGNTPTPLEAIGAVQLVSADTGQVLLESHL